MGGSTEDPTIRAVFNRLIDTSPARMIRCDPLCNGASVITPDIILLTPALDVTPGMSD